MPTTTQLQSDADYDEMIDARYDDPMADVDYDDYNPCYDDFASQYDDDPSPYDGNYSED